MSSGCMSEVDEENAFDVEYPDGGTIRRKPPRFGAWEVAISAAPNASADLMCIT